MLLSETVNVDIIPAIIPSSREDLEEKLAKAGEFAREVQVDVVDGVFAQPQSWPYTENGDLVSHLPSTLFKNHVVEVDLMVDTPEDHIEDWARAGAAKIVVHLEAVKDFSFIVNHCKGSSYRLGVAISNDTPLSILDAHDLSCVDYIQLMGIKEIGSQGQPFDERVIDRIQEVLRAYPEFIISIDGAVSEDTITRLYEAGARRFIVGSAIMNAHDPKQAFSALSTLSL